MRPSAPETPSIDLNADLGEGPDEEALYPLVTSANIACGGHAGNAETMARALERCVMHGVAPGAHPSYPDLPGFGRRSLPLAPGPLAQAVADQVGRLARLAAGGGMRLAHVKLHGALYHDAARDREIALAVANGVRRVASDLILVGSAGSSALAIWEGIGFRVAREGFADRLYGADLSLLPRDQPGAVIVDPLAAAAQAVGLARGGSCDTICVHGDTPGAARLLAAVRDALASAGFAFRSPVLTTDRP